MATQLNIIRGDYLSTQTVNLTSDTDDFTDLQCTGQIRTHPDGDLLYQFAPDVVYGAQYSGSVTFDIPASESKNFPPINLYGDIEFYATGIQQQTLYQFRLDVSPDVARF